MSRVCVSFEKPTKCDDCPLCSLVIKETYHDTWSHEEYKDDIWCSLLDGIVEHDTVDKDCPLEIEKEAIPIEWIEKWKVQTDHDAYMRGTINDLIRDWRKENESLNSN